MDYQSFFKHRLGMLRAEGRYRVFAYLERRCGRFPRAYDYRIGTEVTVWCSNDYLGMKLPRLLSCSFIRTLEPKGCIKMIREMLGLAEGILQDLHNDHSEVDALMDRIMNAEDPSQREPLSQELNTKLLAHAHAEQEVLYHQCCCGLRAGASGASSRRFSFHVAVKQLAFDLS
jgi:hypothetical protein